MQTLQTIQQLQPAAAISILLALPWIAATLMHAFGAGASNARGEEWSQLAGAAVRWFGTVARPARIGATPVLRFPVRQSTPRLAPASRIRQGSYPHAA
jgi:hypothetical protein